MTLVLKRTKPAFPSFANEFFGKNFMNEFVDPCATVGIPAVNVAESNIDFRIELAVPGLSKDDFKIDLEKNVLTISTKKKMKLKMKLLRLKFRKSTTGVNSITIRSAAHSGYRET
mgnify:CR=1 FL=1